VGSEGRTVLFVSHNMVSIQKLCGSGILLRDGNVREAGSMNKVIESYLNDSTSTGNVSVGELPRAHHDYGVIARFINAWPVNSKGDRTTNFKLGEDISFDLEIKAYDRIDGLSIVAGLDTYMDYRITTVLSEESGMFFSSNKNDAVIPINLKLPGLHLKPGTYSLTLGIRRNKLALDHVVKAINFEISEISVNHKNRDSWTLGDVLTESIWHLS
jgi:lipopolysaccharide transport system ATP-binding protein